MGNICCRDSLLDSVLPLFSSVSKHRWDETRRRRFRASQKSEISLQESTLGTKKQWKRCGSFERDNNCRDYNLGLAMQLTYNCSWQNIFPLHYPVSFIIRGNLVPRASFPSTSCRKTRALGTTILKWQRQITEFWLSGSLRSLPLCACLKCLLPELLFSDRWSRETKLWERDWNTQLQEVISLVFNLFKFWPCFDKFSYLVRFPFNQTLRKFRSKTEWNVSVQPEVFPRKDRPTSRGGPLFSVGPVRSKWPFRCAVFTRTIWANLEENTSR